MMILGLDLGVIGPAIMSLAGTAIALRLLAERHDRE